MTSDVSFRKSANGVVLGTLARGTELTLRKTEGSWAEFRLEGWIYNQSISPDSRDGFDVVTRSRENIRAEPNGTVVARASLGALFHRDEQRNGWSRVRRDVWIPRAAIQSLSNPPATAQRPPARDTARRAAPAARDTAAAIGAGLTGAAPPGSHVELAGATRLLTTPDGTSLGTLEKGGRARVVSRSGEWVRVQVEGWVREGDTRPASDSGTLAGITAAEVRAAPAQFVGKVVDWRVQFLAVQKADELRPEIPSGRHYLLTRGPLPESGFVYVIIPADQVERFRSLTPLQEIMVRGTIKAASTRYLPNPVLELVALVNTP